MPNKLKFNAIGNEENSLFKGNWAIDTSPNNTGGGPSSETGFYNGVSVPEGGYVLYRNGKAFTANNDTELIGYIKSLGGSVSNITEAINWTRAQDDSVLVDIDYENIVVDGKFGLFNNGDFRLGNNTNFTWGTFNNTDQFSGNGCLEFTGGGGASAYSSEFVEVDTSKTYQMICYARTLQRGSQNNTLAGGHIGFACYDSSYRFIDLRNCGGVGNTTLSRDLKPGDSHIYLNSISDWVTGADVTATRQIFRHVLIFPASHPEYNKPHQYTRIGYGDFNLYYKSAVQTDIGDWQLKLANSSGSDINMPNIGYATPEGTPISRGMAGGSFNYALGAPNYPETWTRYVTPPFTGENRNSGIPFRFATKYVRFLILRNYNRRGETVKDHKFALDNIFFGQVGPGVDYRNTLMP